MLKYQYWDGIHQETTIIVKMGESLNTFLKTCILELGKSYKQLDGAPAEGFLLVKGDYMISAHTQNLQG